MRGICADYFESHLGPVLKCVQDTQKQLNAQLEAIRDVLDKKANAKDVPTFAQVEGLVDGEVLTAAQFRSFSAVVDEKLAALSATLSQKADASDVPAFGGAASKATSDCVASESSAKNSARIQVLIAAASARFDRQLRDVRRQLRELQESRQVCQPTDLPQDDLMTPRRMIERWPGRALGSSAQSDAGSDVGSATESIAGSLAGSAAGSVGGLSSEEREELRRIRTLMAAAGTAFSRDIRDLRKKFSEMQGELTAVRTKLPRA